MSESPIAGTQIIEQSQTAVPVARSRGPSVVLIAIVIAIIGSGVLLTALTSDVTKVSEPGVKLVDGRPFLIDRVGDWTGSELQGLSDVEKNILPADTEGARRVYTDKDGDQLFCSIVLAGRDTASVHRPELCLPGQGWSIQNEYVQSIPVAAVPGGTLEVMRINGARTIQFANGQTGLYRSIFVYWFVGKDRVTARHWQRILWTSKDRVLYNTNHRWAYILISIPVTANVAQDGNVKPPEEAMKVVTRFVQDIYPTLVGK
jgi:EpsI family protein